MGEQAVRTPLQDMDLNTTGLWDRSLVQLTLSRFRLFVREPEAIFWIFVFPILLALGLGIAFRNQPPQIPHIGVVGANLATRLRADKNLSVIAMTRQEGERALEAGKIQLLAIGTPDRVVYRFDDTNPDSRTARLITDRALEDSSGRPEPFKTSNDLVREPGSRYIDFVVPGLLGMNLMGSAIWGVGLAIVDFRQKKLLKRLVASPMRRWRMRCGSARCMSFPTAARNWRRSTSSPTCRRKRRWRRRASRWSSSRGSTRSKACWC